MLNTIVNGIYGQRLSDPLHASLDTDADFVLSEIPINWQSSPSQIAVNFEAWRKCVGRHEMVPALVADADVFESTQNFSWTDIVSVLKESGATKVVLAIDDDNAVSRRLSPRFFDESARTEFSGRVSRAIETISRELPCSVSLTIEELCPGGLDPSDGIKLAKQFVDSGALEIIGSGGSIDFPMLKYRRPTRQKADRNFSMADWPETWMSSALWLINVLKVPIYAQGQVEDSIKARSAARDLGLTGIINASVKDPSSL